MLVYKLEHFFPKYCETTKTFYRYNFSIIYYQQINTDIPFGNVKRKKNPHVDKEKINRKQAQNLFLSRH